MSKPTLAEVLAAVQEISRRLDKINGKIDEHETRLREHDIALTKLNTQEEHHSVNWSLVTQAVMAVLQFIILAILSGVIKK